MIIGYDAKRAFQNFTGLGNYSRTLVETLATHFPEHQYHLFAPRDSTSPRVDFLKNATPITRGLANSVFSHFPNRFYKNIPAFWRSYFIKNDLEKHKIQLFHGLSHELPLKIPKNIKSVVTMHDLIHERYPEFYPFFDRKIYSQKFRSACQRADVVVAISEQTKRDIVDFYNISPEKIRVIYQSCDPQFSQAANIPPQYSTHSETFFLEKKEKNRLFLAQKYKIDTPFLLNVGTINARKNLLGLLEAFLLLEKKDLSLVVVGNGSGEYFARVKRFVEEKKLSGRVYFLPKIDFQDLPRFYQTAEVFVLPSFFEGFGIPIIEALWSGCPVVTTEGGCFAEAGGADSIYINPNDSQSIATAIDKVLKNKELQKEMREKGRLFVQKFGQKKIGQEWINLYQSMLNF